MGALSLKQGQFMLAYIQPTTITARFSKGSTSELLAIGWSPGLFYEMLPYFDWLKQYAGVDPPMDSKWISRPRPANLRMMDIAHDMLSNPYDETVGLLLYEHKVREYLLELLMEAGKKPPPKIKLTTAEREMIAAIAEEITANPDKKYPIALLTMKAGINSIKLKGAFKEIYGHGIFEHQMAARMKEARRLLLETDLSPKQVSAMIGYKLTTSFVSRFKKHFGYYSSEISKSRL